jgi:hypothetical protein
MWCSPPIRGESQTCIRWDLQAAARMTERRLFAFPDLPQRVREVIDEI